MRAAAEGRNVEAIVAGLTAAGAPFAMREVGGPAAPVRAWLGGPRTVRDVVEASVHFGSAPFLISGTERLSFAEHAGAVGALAQHFVGRLGIRVGDRIAIAMRNLPEWSVAFWAAAAIGAIAVPLNAWWTREELDYALADSGARVLVVDAERAVRLGNDSLARIESVLVAGHDADPALPTVESVAGMGAVLPPGRLDEDMPATLFYTSGTTGRPKGALGTHRNMVSNLLSRRFYRALDAERTGRPLSTAVPTTLLTVPLFHVTGSHSYLLPALATGSSLVLMRKWDVAEALRLIEQERITALGGVPFMALQLLDAYRPGVHDLSSLTAVAVGGALPPPDLVSRLAAAFPTVTAGNGYGMTETSSVAIYNYGEDYRRHPQATGRVSPIMDVRLVPADESPAPRGAGELWLRGANVVSEYWHRPDETAATFRPGGWLRTGDLAHVDSAGIVSIVGRSKEVIVRGGENIAPSEVSAALASHPDVRDVAVVAVPDRLLGEAIGAVVRIDGAHRPGVEALREHAAARLAAYKVPARIVVTTDPLPRSAQGKLERAAITALLEQQRE